MSGEMFNEKELADMPVRLEQPKSTGSTVDNILDMVDARSGLSFILNDQVFERMWRAAKVYASSDFAPRDFKGSTGNVFIAMNLAQRFGVDFFMLMQNMYIVHGRPGLEAKLMIALVNASNTFTGPIQWKTERGQNGKIKSMTAYAKHTKNGETCEATVDGEMVSLFGWDKDKKRRDGNGYEKSKWTQMPDQMYSYRSAAFLIRKYCPEVILGLSTTDELREVHDTTKDQGPLYKTVGEIAAYAASKGMPPMDFDVMAVACDITPKEITHTPPKLAQLTGMVDEWLPPDATPPAETVPADAPPPADKPAVKVIDETEKPADKPKPKRGKDKNISVGEIADLVEAGKQGGLAETREALLQVASDHCKANIKDLTQLTVGEGREILKKLLGE